MKRTNAVVFGVSAALLVSVIACSEERAAPIRVAAVRRTVVRPPEQGVGQPAAAVEPRVHRRTERVARVARRRVAPREPARTERVAPREPARTERGGAAGSGTNGASGAAGSGTGGTGGNPPQCNASAAPQVGRLGLSPVVNSGLTGLLYAAQPPGSNDWYLVERGGRILVWTGGALRPTPFLNLSSELPIPTSYDERGLFSLAFAPDYATSGLFYLVLTPTAGASLDHDMVLEYRRSSGDPFVADPGSRRVLLDLTPGGVDIIPLRNQVHNGGTVAFGPDGMLYVGMGDGGGACNSARPGVPQDVSNVYGKLLRLDPKAPAPHAAAGNPFTSGGDARVYHYGLRNPFRFSFDSATGDLYIGNVGQEAFDEIEFAARGTPGLNFGWPDFEGTNANTCPGAAALRSGSTHTQPIHIVDGSRPQAWSSR